MKSHPRDLLSVCVLLLATQFAFPLSAAADDCGAAGAAEAGHVILENICSSGDQSTESSETPSAATSSAADSISAFSGTVEEVLWNPICAGELGATSLDETTGCGMVRRCGDGSQLLVSLFTRTVRYVDGDRSAVGSWMPQGTECLSFGEVETRNRVQAGPVPLPDVTWEMVLREVQRVGLPSLEVRVQPAERTLVNFDTNFYAEPEAFERQLTLLGQGVEVRAEPVEFAWSFGDGTTDATESPGAPYPDLEVTHAYTDADVTVEPSVAVTYTAEFRVGAGEWQQIPETVTISGPPVSLRVVEATPVLSGEGQYG